MEDHRAITIGADTYRLQVWVRVVLTTLTVVPLVLVVSIHSSSSSVIGIFVFAVLQIPTLLLPWLPEPSFGEPAPDLLDLVQGVLQVGIVVLGLFTTISSSNFGTIGDYPVILTLMGLIGAASHDGKGQLAGYRRTTSFGESLACLFRF